MWPRHTIKNCALCLVTFFFITLGASPLGAGTYLDSAHGNTAYGVKRSATGFPTDYAIGNCAHCHEQHASIEGVEPAPTNSDPLTQKYLLFDKNHTSQTANFCFDCHQASGYQSGGISINKSYSYNFGGNTTASSYDTDILTAFSHTGATGSSHHLPDIVSQALGKTMYDANGVAWSLPADINPCDACHNPHIAQRNKNASYDATKSAVSRPSDHDNKWGDDTTERMNAAYTDYQAPYWYGSTTAYEPANDATTNGSNLPNYVRLCTDCHNDYNTINSTNPRLPSTPRAIRKLSWKTAYVSVTPDGHGEIDGGINYARAPYVNGGYRTLNCTDCHEPHGSPTNIYLVRSSINGASISVTSTSDAAWQNFCFNACHVSSSHNPSKPGCASCHYHGGGRGGF
ncbi:MAG: hypothetical protein ACOYU4_00330 [Thermodesulfobacteriota bacterium]